MWKAPHNHIDEKKNTTFRLDSILLKQNCINLRTAFRIPTHAGKLQDSIRWCYSIVTFKSYFHRKFYSLCSSCKNKKNIIFEFKEEKTFWKSKISSKMYKFYKQAIKTFLRLFFYYHKRVAKFKIAWTFWKTNKRANIEIKFLRFIKFYTSIIFNLRGMA